MYLSFWHSFVDDGLTFFIFFAKKLYYRFSTYLFNGTTFEIINSGEEKLKKKTADLAYLVS